MSNLPHAFGFRDLIAYQKAKQLEREIFQRTRAFPKDEMFSLTDQVRRSSRAIGANIAEAWAKRRYEKHFLSKLTDADGEQQETQHWIGTALDCGYLTQEQSNPIIAKYEEIGRILGGMMAKAESFCGEPKVLRESSVEYFVNATTAD